MKINDANLKFNGTLYPRTRTDSIILHHAESRKCTVEDIHRWHIERGWSGIGYHYFVRKDGSVWLGRREGLIGAHAGSKSGYNSRSIGICFEGDYMRETMPTAQLEAGCALIRDIQGRYDNALKILRHKDVTSTSCPGTNFPFSAMKEYKEKDMIDQKQFEAMYNQVNPIYNTIEQVPSYWKKDVKALISSGAIKGDGKYPIAMREESLKAVIIAYRALKEG